MLIRPVKVLRIQSTNFKWIGFKSVGGVQIPGNGVNSANIQNGQCASLGYTADCYSCTSNRLQGLFG